VPGGEIQVGFATTFGRQLSADVIGNTFPVQGSDAAPPGPRPVATRANAVLSF
jgi:hypothetical protein